MSIAKRLPCTLVSVVCLVLWCPVGGGDAASSTPSIEPQIARQWYSAYLKNHLRTYQTNANICSLGHVQGIRLSPFVTGQLLNASYRNYCSIPFIYLERSTNKQSLLLVMQVDVNNERFTNLQLVSDVNIQNIYVVVQVTGYQRGKYKIINGGQHSFSFGLSEKMSKSFVIEKRYQLNDRLNIRLLNDANELNTVALDTSNSFTAVCIRFVLFER